MKLKLVILLLLTAAISFAQQEEKRNHFSIDLGAGYSRYLSNLDGDDIKRNGFSGLFRFNWHPGHLLTMSIESGYQYLYSYSSAINDGNNVLTNVDISMVSIPVFVSFSMKILPETFPYIEVSYGPGMFILFNSIEDKNGKISNSLVSSGTLLGISYIRPISNTLNIGAEIKYLDLEKTNDSDLSLYAIVRFSF